LEDEGLRRWYDNVSRSSVITADVYLCRSGGFCKDYKQTPKHNRRHERSLPKKPRVPSNRGDNSKRERDKRHLQKAISKDVWIQVEERPNQAQH